MPICAGSCGLCCTASARAEQALADLSGEFTARMDSECARLDRARHAVVEAGFTYAKKEALCHAAQDIKGEAATFGFPAVASAADSLCRLVEFTPNATPIQIKLVNQHVNAIRAIYRKYAHSDAEDLAGRLTHRLHEVTDDFLERENINRPDLLEQIRSPSIAP